MHGAFVPHAADGVDAVASLFCFSAATVCAQSGFSGVLVLCSMIVALLRCQADGILAALLSRLYGICIQHVATLLGMP
jgi:hypothetical protein